MPWSLKTPSRAAVATVTATTSQSILDLWLTVPVRISARLLTCFQHPQVFFSACVKTGLKKSIINL
jgi:hypothetical protein